MAQDVEGEWLSVSAAARRLGISRQAIQQRIRRKAIVTRQDNTGAPQVYVSGASASYSTASAEQPDASVAASSVQAPSRLFSLDDVRQLMGEQRQAHESALAAVARSHRESVQLLLERVDAAELRAEQTAEELKALSDRLMSPWWTRWIGSSKKSILR